MLDTFEPYWLWLALGLLLVAAEMLAPGFFLIWLAGAALLTGAAAYLLPLGVPLQVLLFAVLAIATVYIGKRYLRDNPITEADPAMNQRGLRMAGQIATVTAAIANGEGRVHIGDSEWIARGADAAVGAKVRITGTDGAELLVEPV
jgi:membrane protein implicated in regulation of membrane protease activity